MDTTNNQQTQHLDSTKKKNLKLHFIHLIITTNRIIVYCNVSCFFFYYLVFFCCIVFYYVGKLEDIVDWLMVEIVHFNQGFVLG